MKITKARLKEIINEEMEDQLDEAYPGGYIRGVDIESPEFKKWQAKQKSPGIERPPSLESRVAKLEAKLDELEKSLGGSTAVTQVELEE